MAVENDGEAVPHCGACGLAAGDGREGVEVVGIGHQTYNEVGAIVTVVLSGAHLERDLQVVDAVVEQGHHSPALDIGALIGVEIE